MEDLSVDRTCVQVFAKISAAISHEIKNTLSIINENAGLLEDLAQMAQEGGGVPLERIRPITMVIAKQVDRSNLIMKNLNRFAHSADAFLAHGNLKETLDLVVALTNRQATMKNISTRVDCPVDIAFSTSLIALESLVYLTLLALFERCGEGSCLALEARGGTPDITLCFTVKNNHQLSLDGYPDKRQELLLDQLAASCRRERDRLLVTFPAVVG
jgi:hypothetical protein